MIAALTIGLARAVEVALIVGAGTEWGPACRPDTAPCDPGARVLTSELRYADDDAWRVNFLLSGQIPADQRLVFATPDARVALRGFFGATVRAATLPAIEAALAPLRAREDVTLLVYIASHGTAEGVHLDDGIHSFEQLEARIEAASGGQVRALLADSCLSARWDGAQARGGFGVYDVLEFPEIQHNAPYLRAAVDEATRELPELGGGLFTHVLTSALLGAGDRDGDGQVDAQELSDFAHGYRAAFGASYVPFVAAPDARTALNTFAGPAGLTLGGEASSARWYITRRFGDEDVLLAEVYTEAGERVRLGLPDGEVLVWRVPYGLEPGLSRERRKGDTGERCPVQLSAGATAAFLSCGQSFRVPGSRGAGETPAEESTVVAWISAQGNLPPAPVPSNAVHYHGGRKWVLGADLSVGSGLLGRGGALVGPGASALWTGVGWMQLSLGVSAREELGADEPVRLTHAQASAWLDGVMWSSPKQRLALGGGIGVGALFLPGPASAAAPTFELTLGPRWSRGAFELSGGWAPTVLLLDDDLAGGLSPALDLRRLTLSATLRRAR